MMRSIFVGITVFFAACFRTQANPTSYVSEGQRYSVEVLREGGDVVWGFDFLPDGRALLTERGGAVYLVDPVTRSTRKVSGVPVVFAQGQGGLLDVRVAPDYSKSGRIYLTYSDPVGKGATTTLARATLQGDALLKFERIAVANAASESEIHFGSRIEFGDEGDVFFGVGERGDRDRAQDTTVHNGKILRVSSRGSVEVWSRGHRNPQGLARQPGTGALFECEFGPRGGDEINLIERGKNYGWPLVTLGREYHGPKIGVPHQDGMEDPIAFYVPSISPSGMSFYTGDRFPSWKGNLFLAALSGQHLRRVVLEGKRVVRQEALLSNLGWRFRNVRTGPEGLLYFSTDEGKFARLAPVLRP